MPTCRACHNYIKTISLFASSSSDQSMLLQPFYVPMLSSSYSKQSLSHNVSAEVSLTTHSRILPERWQSLRRSRNSSPLQNQKLTTLFTGACHRTLSWGRKILQTKQHTAIALRLSLITSFPLQPGIPRGLFPGGVWATDCVCESHLSHPSDIPCQSHPLWLTPLIFILWPVQIIKTLITKCSPASHKFYVT